MKVFFKIWAVVAVWVGSIVMVGFAMWGAAEGIKATGFVFSEGDFWSEVIVWVMAVIGTVVYIAGSVSGSIWISEGYERNSDCESSW